MTLNYSIIAKEIAMVSGIFLEGRSQTLLYSCKWGRHPGGVLPYMGYIGMCRCEGYGFQAVYSGIGYINQSVWL